MFLCRPTTVILSYAILPNNVNERNDVPLHVILPNEILHNVILLSVILLC